jgi:DNA invertase Pin-like site-specific DNA recombinase
MKKRAAIYCRVSTADQHPETQLYDLREMAKQRGYEIVHEYTDTISGAKSKRPGLDQLLVRVLGLGVMRTGVVAGVLG